MDKLVMVTSSPKDFLVLDLLGGGTVAGCPVTAIDVASRSWVALSIMLVLVSLSVTGCIVENIAKEVSEEWGSRLTSDYM